MLFRSKNSVTANQIFGTERMNAYEILEASLNLRFVEVRDRVEYTMRTNFRKIDKVAVWEFYVFQ